MPSTITPQQQHEHQHQHNPAQLGTNDRIKHVPHPGHRLIIVSLFLRETIQFQQSSPSPHFPHQLADQQHLLEQHPQQPPYPYDDDQQPPLPQSALSAKDHPHPIDPASRRGSAANVIAAITPHHPHADPSSLTQDLLTADPATQQQAQLELHEELTAQNTRTHPVPPSPPEHLGNPGDGPYIPSQSAQQQQHQQQQQQHSHNHHHHHHSSSASSISHPLPIHELPARLHSFTLSHPPHHSSTHSRSHSQSASRRASSTSHTFKSGFFSQSLTHNQAGSHGHQLQSSPFVEHGNSRSSSTGTLPAANGGAADQTAGQYPPMPSSASSAASSGMQQSLAHHNQAGSTGSAGSTGTSSAGAGAGIAPLSIINDLANKQQQSQHAAAAAAAAAAIGVGASPSSVASATPAAGASAGTPNASIGGAAASLTHTPSLTTDDRHNPFAASAATGLISGAVTPRRTSSPLTGGTTTPGGFPGRLTALTALSRSSAGSGPPAGPAITGALRALSPIPATPQGPSESSSVATPGTTGPPSTAASPGQALTATPSASTGSSSHIGTPMLAKPKPKSFLQQTLVRPPPSLANLKKDAASTGSITTLGPATASLTAPTSLVSSPHIRSHSPAIDGASGLHRGGSVRVGPVGEGGSILSRSKSSGPGLGSGLGASGILPTKASLLAASAGRGLSKLDTQDQPQTYPVLHDHGRGMAPPSSSAAAPSSPAQFPSRLQPQDVFAAASATSQTSSGHDDASIMQDASKTTGTRGLGIHAPKPVVAAVQSVKSILTGKKDAAKADEQGDPAKADAEGEAEASSAQSSQAADSASPAGPSKEEEKASESLAGSTSSLSSAAGSANTASTPPSSTSGSGPGSGTTSRDPTSAPAIRPSRQQQQQTAPAQERRKQSRERSERASALAATSMATSRPGTSRSRSRHHHYHHHHHHHHAPLPRRTSSMASMDSHVSSGTVTTTTTSGAHAVRGSDTRDLNSSTPSGDGLDEDLQRLEEPIAEEDFLQHRGDADALDTDEDDEEGGAQEVLPPFEFVPNPSANGGLFNAVESLGTLGQGRYGAKGRMKHAAGRVGATTTGVTTPTAPPSGAAKGGSGIGLGLGGAGDRGAVMRRSTNRLFIGTLGISVDGWLGSEEQEIIERRLLEERQASPVWVDDSTFERSYHDFCKALLWPTFHYTLPSERALEKQHEAFQAYIDVNRAFAERIAEHWREGDIVWINDYHLLLVPQMLRELLGPSATIGLFMHISFPSSEMFRCLAVRENLLRGMLGADLLGFQTHNNCRHFRQTVSRILQLEATPKGIQLDTISGRGGFVTVNAFPIGIDVRSLNMKRREDDVQEWIERLQTRYEGRKIIVGRDKLDWIKGVRQKLLAYELFLEEHPEWVNQVVLIQVALATTEENEEAGQASDVVARINRRWGSLTYQPVVFLHVQDITFSQYLALLTVADAFLASSLREGMALTPHEYIICQEVKHRPLILSEFVGSYSSLRACLGFNPFNTKQASMAIFKALTMEEEEMFERWQDLHRTVVTQTAQHWITSFLSRLERSHAEQQFRDTAFIPRLEIAQLVSEWRAAKTRLVLLDLEDTLVSQTPLSLHKFGFRPSEQLLNRLRALTADPKNSVYVLSGMGMANLNQLVTEVPRLGVIAENGCFVKHCGESDSNSWISMVGGFNLQWRAPVKDILAYFTERTPGSWMEDRGASICWVYWNEELGEPTSHEAQWARRQAAEVQNLIYDSLAERFSLRITPGPASFLCSPKNTSRASAVQYLMQLSAMGGFWNGGNTIAPDQFMNQSGSKGRPQKSQLDAVLREEALKTSGRATPGEIAADSPYKLPSNHWPAPQPSAPRSAAKDRLPTETSGVRNLQGLFGFGPASAQQMQPNAGSFDFVLAISQDEGLLRYVNGLDLPFAPVTCTTVDLTRSKGSDAGNHLEGVEEVEEALDEILEFRERDRRWGRPAMTDV
ncbi:Trehalose-6-P synthase/phosphatase complex subunit [Tilletia horrida]|nr:Trehalose-6-P synthase/phosphatase complex subunit [Tilletia horrida]